MRCNLMDEAIESTNTPIKHLNRLTQKPWRFRYTVTMEKKVFQKETTLRSPKPNWIEVIKNQHNNNIENKSKLKNRVKCPKTSNNRVVRDTRAHEPEREPEDRQRRWVEVERCKRGLTLLVQLL
jgi:hypothetical protein